MVGTPSVPQSKGVLSLQLPPPSYTDQLAANIGGAAANGGQLHGGQRAALEQHAALDQHLEAELQRQQQEHAILQRQLVRFCWPAPLASAVTLDVNTVCQEPHAPRRTCHTCRGPGAGS